MAIFLVIEACPLPQRGVAFQIFHSPAIDHRLVLFLSCFTSPGSPARVPKLEPESKSLPLLSLIDTRGRIPSLSSSRSVAVGGGSPSRVAISTKLTVRSDNLQRKPGPRSGQPQQPGQSRTCSDLRRTRPCDVGWGGPLSLCSVLLLPTRGQQDRQWEPHNLPQWKSDVGGRIGGVLCLTAPFRR